MWKSICATSHTASEACANERIARYRGLCSNAYGCGLYFKPAKKRMLAATTRRNRLALVQKPVPRLKPGWALVRVRLAGICNTDIEILRRYHNIQGTIVHES